MPFHHYLPATYLAAFSYEDERTSRDKPPRSRMIYAGDKSNNNCFQSAIRNVAGINNLYMLSSGDNPNIIEETWSRYETQLPTAIERLINGRLDANLWARILVPFIASLFVRSTNFDERFENRLRRLGLDDDYFESNPDNTNQARLFELQRLLAPVLAAEWIVLHTSGGIPVITNDIAYTPFRHRTISDFGFAFPLNLDHILLLVPKIEREIIELRNGSWYPIIQYPTLEPNNHIGLNNALTHFAQRFIFGSDRALIQRLLQEQNVPAEIPEPGEFGFMSGRLARVHEFTWHRLVSFLSRGPGNESSYLFDINFNVIPSGWTPPINLPDNLPQFPSELRRQGDKIVVSFYDAEELPDHAWLIRG